MGAKINIVTVNAGSSSIKIDVFSVINNEPTRVLHADVSGIEQTTAELTVISGFDEKEVSILPESTFDAAVSALQSIITENIDSSSVTAVGHRVVHGGPHYSEPTRITEQLLQDLESIATFDPEHTPASLELMRRMIIMYPGADQVACFDTAFFHNMPEVAQRIALPRQYEAKGIRRYGFHGLSYTYVQKEFAKIAGPAAKNGRVIYAHLGSGASLAATMQGKAIDTTMGFSPASGLVMSSRVGDIDAGLVGYLLKTEELAADQFMHLINFESGLKGVSELSADMYTLLQHESTNRHAADAVDLFVYHVRKSIGALVAALGGLDSLVFTGGIGERSAPLRARICADFDYLGLALDTSANEKSEQLISSDDSRVGVHVISTNEALIIAESVKKICNIPITNGGNYGIS